jgi:hypothetical protein
MGKKKVLVYVYYWNLGLCALETFLCFKSCLIRICLSQCQYNPEM